jgi:hypothetical protein
MFKKFFRRAARVATIATVLATLPPATLPAAVAPVAAASPGTLYGVTRSQDLVTIDPATGAFTTLSNLFLPGAVDSQASELAANPAAGKLYADRQSFVNTSSGSVFTEELLTINAATGAVVNSVSGHFGNLVVDQSTGTLFGFDGFSVFRINPSNGAATKLTTIGDAGSYIWSLGIDPNTHTIYASREDISGSSEDATTRIFTVNTTSGAATTGPLLTQVVRQIVVDPESGQLFGVTDSFTHDFVRIDPSAGATDLVATIVPSADSNVDVQFGMAADGTSHTVFGDVLTYDISSGDLADQPVSIQDQTGAVNLTAAHTDTFISGGLAFAGPAPTISPDTIRADVQGALISGAITKSGVAKNLLAELNEAQAARNRGQCKTAGNIYQQFVNDVSAQAGKSIGTPTAAQLISEAQFLIANCP